MGKVENKDAPFGGRGRALPAGGYCPKAAAAVSYTHLDVYKRQGAV